MDWAGYVKGARKFLRAEKRNKCASFDCAPGPKCEKMEFRRSCKQKRLRTLYAFPLFLVSSTDITSLIESWCIVFVEIQYLGDKINLKSVSEPFIFAQYTRNFVGKTHVIHTRNQRTSSPPGFRAPFITVYLRSRSTD